MIRLRLSDDVRWRTAIYDVGHAITVSGTGIAETVTVNIGIGGMGQAVSRQCQHLRQTQDWLMRSIACMLAGRTAELLIFGETVAGAGGFDDCDLASGQRTCGRR
ncbi:hypothetical protein G6L58_13560 [Agrobacterium tumefaciens]|uniref:hypothetical protein n=1 Tax=Agrobacterium tumefaciens TaxID=358 RepID=UPI0013CE3E29|nr:hypothetical protein [Agrobacterium tumefaciens]